MARSDEPSSADYLIAIAGAARKRKDGSRGLTLTKQEALKLLRATLEWHPPKAPEFDIANTRGENELARHAIGAVMADAVLPPLTSDDLAPDLIENCLALIEADIAPSVTQALPELVRIQPSLLERSVTLIRKMIASRDPDNTAAGFYATYRWMDMAKERGIPELPRRLVDSIISMVEARRAPGLLPALRNSLHALEAGILTEMDRERLADTLGSIFIETDYSQQTPNEIETIVITLVRAAAVRRKFFPCFLN